MQACNLMQVACMHVPDCCSTSCGAADTFGVFLWGLRFLSVLCYYVLLQVWLQVLLLLGQVIGSHWSTAEPKLHVWLLLRYFLGCVG
jgi:hypothetical protein